MSRGFRLSLLAPLIAMAGCSTQGYMGDQPQIGPVKPASEVTVEMEGDDMVCVTENSIRTCVPRVGDTSDADL